MFNLCLSRYRTSEQGTFGKIQLDGYIYKTLELPWQDNKRQVSCIPVGQYICSLIRSPRFGRVYQVTEVPGRSAILIHWGNYAGQVPTYRTHSYGCILLGKKEGILDKQQAILASMITFRKFMTQLAGKSFILDVQENY